MDDHLKAELLQRAQEVRLNAHAPYSKFRVGAAVLTEDGEVYVGANVENAAYPEGWCAETSAIGQMIAAGIPGEGRRIAAVVVVADRVDGGIVCTPCGGCRQRLKEFSHPSTLIHCSDPTGDGQDFTMAQLLPAGFSMDERF
ncbi:cytidine deaminase [Kaistia defluvii]|uniref:cytidine deaminase n=1 Tax=Kaistia defluvii TaxID=410841 RepID=UPI00224DFBAD|nr:cytidine deaminase [Kaistia defluvii]MCX5520944.1 cytidine deaminase [Kaistia defluvii]